MVEGVVISVVLSVTDKPHPGCQTSLVRVLYIRICLLTGKDQLACAHTREEAQTSRHITLLLTTLAPDLLHCL
jgi:hypothetical protein